MLLFGAVSFKRSHVQVAPPLTPAAYSHMLPGTGGEAADAMGTILPN
jgi:hypothetical protein